MIEIQTVKGPRKVRGRAYKGWGLHGAHGGRLVTHLPTGRLVMALDDACEARIFVDLLSAEGVDAAAPVETLAANERMQMVMGYAKLHDLRTGFWNGYIDGRPQPGSPWFVHWEAIQHHGRKQSRRRARLRRKRAARTP